MIFVFRVIDEYIHKAIKLRDIFPDLINQVQVLVNFSEGLSGSLVFIGKISVGINYKADHNNAEYQCQADITFS